MNPMRSSSSSHPRSVHAWTDWTSTPVSSRSRFGDDVWHLDIHLAGRRPDQNRLAWNALQSDGSRLTDPQHVVLLRAAKQYLWSMMVDPPEGQKRPSPLTLYAQGRLLRTLIGWMIADGMTSFRMLDPSAVRRMTAWLRARPGKLPERTLKPVTIGSYLIIIVNMYRQRAKLEDSPLTDPFPGHAAFEVAGLTSATKGAIPFIPDSIAVDLLSKALLWAESYSTDIIAAFELRSEVVADAKQKGLSRHVTKRLVREAIQSANIIGPDGQPLVTPRSIRKHSLHLVDSCFILIAGFVGMRVSEILSMQVGAIEYHPIGDTGIEQAYIAARLFKTADNPHGRPEKWIAPTPVIRTVECLERLSAPLRAVSGRRELFLVKGGPLHNQVLPLTGFHITERINCFAAFVGVPHHKGTPWPFSPHQFRKTFARFVARRDRSQLLALADHFKHVSVAMTSRGYVGNDFSLHELVDHQGQTETALALDNLLKSDRLGGRMGERIMARNTTYRGRAGEQVRRDYVAFVLAETDLRIHACDYGWCVFQAELSVCGGEVAPSEANRSPSVCIGCPNFATTDEHAGYWRDRRERNLALWDDASVLTRATLAKALEECDRVLARLSKGHDE
jgi:integrase